MITENKHWTIGLITDVSDQAIKLKLESLDEIWLPRKQCEDLPLDVEVNDTVEVGVPMWLWEKKEEELNKELY